MPFGDVLGLFENFDFFRPSDPPYPSPRGPEIPIRITTGNPGKSGKMWGRNFRSSKKKISGDSKDAFQCNFSSSFHLTHSHIQTLSETFTVGLYRRVGGGSPTPPPPRGTLWRSDSGKFGDAAGTQKQIYGPQRCTKTCSPPPIHSKSSIKITTYRTIFWSKISHRHFF